MQLKTLDDYIDQVHEKFPQFSRTQLEKILKFGFRSFYTHVLYGGDILNKSPYFTMYCGKIFSKGDLFHKYRIIKSRIKLRIKYKRNKTQYDGYYYFGLTEEAYNYYLSQRKKSGRRRQKFHFKEVKFFKILDELYFDHRLKHIFKIPYPIDNGFSFWKNDFTTRDFEYIYRRNKENKLEPVSYE